MGITVDQQVRDVKNAHSEGLNDYDPDGIDEQKLTTSKLKYFLPKGSKVKVTPELVDTLNTIIEDSGVHRGLMEEKLLTYTHLLGPGIGLKQLLKAIQFVILCLTPGMTQTKAFMITFPDKAQELIDRGSDGSSFATQYAKTHLVKTIMENNTQIGRSVVYAPLEHQLVQKLLELSNGRSASGDNASPTVQLNATLGLLDYIKVPEEQTINLNHGVDEASIEATNNLAEQIAQMAQIQRQNYKAAFIL